VEEKKNEMRTAKKLDGEALLAVFLIFFIVFTIIFTAVMIFGTFSASEDAQNDPQETEGDDEEDVPPEKKPVFVGTTLPQLPTQTDNTKLIENINSANAVLVNAKTGEIVASKQGSVRFAPASMTKVMTLIVALENLTEEDLDQELMMTEEIFEYVNSGDYYKSSCSGFEVTDKVNRLEDLLYGIGVASASDCAMMVACYIFPGIEPSLAEKKFVDLMNQKVSEMGLLNTHFDNVIGYESDNNYSTASDIAAIMMYALNSPLIVDILSVSDAYPFYGKYIKDGEYTDLRFWHHSSLFHTVQGKGKSRIYAYETKYGISFELENADFIGGKTGTLGTGTSSDPWIYSLVSFASLNGETYIAVTAKTYNSYSVMKDVKTIYDTYLN